MRRRDRDADDAEIKPKKKARFGPSRNAQDDIFSPNVDNTIEQGEQSISDKSDDMSENHSCYDSGLYYMSEDQQELQSEQAGLEPFNLHDELEDGNFDDEGNYQPKRDVNAREDVWLEDVSANDIEQAAKAELARQRSIQSEMEVGDEHDRQKLFAQLVQLLNDKETIAQALQRHGAVLKLAKINKQVAGVEVQTSSSAIDRITEVCNSLLSQGVLDIYDRRKESLLQQENSQNQWQFQWSADDKELHGPFTTDQMLDWRSQGYFDGSTVVVRKFGERNFRLLNDLQM